MAQIPTKWDEEADVVIVGYGFAGSAAAIAAHDAGAKVLLLEKAPEADQGGNSRVSGQIVFWPNDIEKAKIYFKALTGPNGQHLGGDGRRMGHRERADTVRELASLIDIAPDTLQASVERYNTFVTEGKDIDFNRESDRIAAIRSPPYYAMELTPSFINTEGGPRRDKDARVIGTTRSRGSTRRAS